MSGKAKTDYLTVCKRGTTKSVYRGTFFKKADLNKFMKTKEFDEKYPATEYTYHIECY